MQLLDRDDKEFYNIHFLKKYMRSGAFVAGGVFKNIFNGEKIKDIDLFFRDMLSYEDCLNKYLQDERFILVYSNTNVEAFKEIETGVIIELVKTKFYRPEDILYHFDFSITKFVYWYETDCDIDGNLTYEYSILHHDKFFEHLNHRRLVLEEEILYPISTFERALRYTKYGYNLCKESKFNLLESVHQLEEIREVEFGASLYFGID